jgi:hypothetical protein
VLKAAAELAVEHLLEQLGHVIWRIAEGAAAKRTVAARRGMSVMMEVMVEIMVTSGEKRAESLVREHSPEDERIVFVVCAHT